MAYVQAWQALFAKPLVNQLIAIIQRDQADALSIVNAERATLGNGPLPPIGEFHKGPGMRTALPWLTVAWESNPFDPDQDHLRASAPRISLALDSGQYDQELAQDNGADYARALDIIVTSAANTDWEASLPINHVTVPSGMTLPNAVGSVKRVFVVDHRSGLVTLEGIPAPIFRVTLPLLFELIEN